jgi:phospholipid/cholesterol/gamma-HCH transport system substrate-binding protein
MRPMRERNQITVAVVGTVLAAALVLLSINLGKIPFLHPSHVYHAQFVNADGLKAGDDVRVEGVSVGSVKKVKVQGDHVLVDFTVKAGLHLGDQSAASVELATILGNLFMQVESAGSGTLRYGGTIPVARTTVPYTVINALNQFGSFAQQTDLATLRTSLKTLAQTLSGISPQTADQTLKGLTSVAQTLAGRQSQIEQILTSTDSITATLNANSAALTSLLTQGDDFLKLLESRQQVISQLLSDTANLGSQLAELMQRNGAQLSSLLSNLNSVTAVLAKQKSQLQTAIDRLGTFSVNIANVTGSGPWLDLMVPTAVIPDNMIKGCGTAPTGKAPCG